MQNGCLYASGTHRLKAFRQLQTFYNTATVQAWPSISEICAPANQPNQPFFTDDSDWCLWFCQTYWLVHTQLAWITILPLSSSQANLIKNGVHIITILAYASTYARTNIHTYCFRYSFISYLPFPSAAVLELPSYHSQSLTSVFSPLCWFLSHSGMEFRLSGTPMKPAKKQKKTTPPSKSKQWVTHTTFTPLCTTTSLTIQSSSYLSIYVAVWHTWNVCKHTDKCILYGAADWMTVFGWLSTLRLHSLSQSKTLPVTTIHSYVLGGVVCMVTFVMGDMLP